MDLITLTLFILGFIVLIAGAEFLVRGASWLAESFGVSSLVVGLTVVAFGTSAPELAVTMTAEFNGTGGIGLGNVVGSNIANVLFILGLSAAVAPLVVDQKLVRLEIPLMIGISVLTLIYALDGVIARIESLLFVIGLVVYIIWAVRQSLRETAAIKAEYAQEFDIKEARTPFNWVKNIVFFLGGLGGIILGANWLVNGAVAIATLFGISEVIIGLTVIAVGTSLPELATSVVASLRGERDIAVGNIIGSNIFNLMFILGLTGTVSPDGIQVEATALGFDLPIMIVVAVATLPAAAIGFRIDRWEGFLFFGYYIAYIITQVLIATENTILPTYNAIMLFFVIPLTVITAGVIYFRQVRNGNNNTPEPQPAAADD